MMEVKIDLWFVEKYVWNSIFDADFVAFCHPPLLDLFVDGEQLRKTPTRGYIGCQADDIHKPIQREYKQTVQSRL